MYYAEAITAELAVLRHLGYSEPDVALLEELTRALQAAQPVPSAPGGTP